MASRPPAPLAAPSGLSLGRRETSQSPRAGNCAGLSTTPHRSAASGKMNQADQLARPLLPHVRLVVTSAVDAVFSSWKLCFGGNPTLPSHLDIWTLGDSCGRRPVGEGDLTGWGTVQDTRPALVPKRDMAACDPTMLDRPTTSPRGQSSPRQAVCSSWTVGLTPVFRRRGTAGAFSSTRSQTVSFAVLKWVSRVVFSHCAPRLKTAGGWTHECSPPRAPEYRPDSRLL